MKYILKIKLKNNMTIEYNREQWEAIMDRVYTFLEMNSTKHPDFDHYRRFYNELQADYVKHEGSTYECVPFREKAIEIIVDADSEVEI